MLTLEDISEVDRIVAIDVEATGHRVLTPAEIGKLPKGMRPPGVIIQIGCVELLRDGAAWCTGATWETLLNPEAPILPAAIRVHGIRPAALKGAPRFDTIRSAFESFVGAAILLAHGALNEIDYLNYETRRCKHVSWDESPYTDARFLDTQKLVRDFLPDCPGSLDAICDRLWIDRSDRFQRHGAMLDAELTADVFVKLTSGFIRDDVRSLSF
jgi:DNA polymerase III subunit epsilon